jgi:plastocyanin
MKKITLLAALLVATITTAQETFTVNWDQSVGGNGTFIIEVGDTVLWSWANGNPHSVTSTSGTESFDSGILTGMGTEFEFTFSTPGSTDYQCDVHPSMVGTITAEIPIMGVDEKFAINVQIYPNPVHDELNIMSLYQLKGYEIHDVYGKKVGWGAGEGTYTALNISYLKAGVYFLSATSAEGLQTTKKIIKK